MPDPARMETAVHDYVAAFDRNDPAAVAALFAENATVEDPVGTAPHVGREAILAFYTASMQTGAKLKLEGPIRLCGDYAAFPFSANITLDGKDLHVDVIDTFRFDQNDQITEMRAYFGPANMHGFS